MLPAPYRVLLRLPGVGRLYALTLVARLPNAASGVVLTLHVVRSLEGSYAQAGVVAAAMTVGIAVGSPWRGRLVDRLGLRRALLPSVVVESGVWLTAPHLDYGPLVGAAVLGGLFLLPVFSVTRQSLAVLVPPAQQRTAFALDSVSAELTFMLAPIAGVMLATQVSTSAALTAVGASTVAAGLLLMWQNPPTASAPADEVTAAPREPWSPDRSLVVVLLAGLASAVVLVGTDVSIVAALNEAGRAGDIGWVGAVWAGGSLLGGLVHGVARRSPSPLVLVLVLAVATVPAGLVAGLGEGWLALAVFVAGVPCAPTLASVNTALVALVPERRRGEVMGWSGTAQTVGNAIGAPAVGWVIDSAGPRAGFLAAALVGALIATTGALALRSRPIAAGKGSGPDGPMDPSRPAGAGREGLGPGPATTPGR